MRKLLPCLLLFPLLAGAQQSSTGAGSRSYEVRCAVCHGSDGNGNERGPTILRFVGSNSDEQVAALIREGRNAMPPHAMEDQEMSELLSFVRTLRPPIQRGRGEPEPVSVTLEGGSTLEGLLLNQSNTDLQLRAADGKIRRLLRDGDAYREAPVLPKMDWLSYNGNYASDRHSPLDQINTANVNQLAAQWIYTIPDAPRLENTPVVIDGIMYVTTVNEVHAIDAASGRRMWDYSQPRTQGILGEAAGGANRGVAVLGDQIFMTTDHAHLLAINRWTGELNWNAPMGDYKTEAVTGTAAPLVVGDLVIAGVAGGEEGVRGFLDAYQASTGERIWRFWTIPARGEKLAETWIGSALEHGCGATWMTGSYDPDLDLLYWAVGNPCPDFNGDERQGDNLYTNSVLALRPKTGELVWYYQFTPHDTHDWDAQESLVLVDETFAGQPRKLLVQANRNGFFYVLDRTDGELLLAKPFVKVTWAEGIDENGRPIKVPGSDPTVEGSLACPSMGGGTNWMSSSYDPGTKLLFVQATESCAVFRKNADSFVLGERWFGGASRGQGERQKFLRAIDIRTGDLAWQRQDYASGRNSGGVLSTDGGLVFFTENSGAFSAADTKTGELLWSFQSNQGWRASPMTYMVGGKQYVAIASSLGFLAFALPN